MATTIAYLVDNGNQTHLELTLMQVSGRGRVVPRLTFAFNARAMGAEKLLEVFQMTAQLVVDNEVLGEGSIRPVVAVVAHDRAVPISFDIPMSHEGLRFIDERRREPVVSVELVVSGLLRIRSGVPPERQLPGVVGVGQDVVPIEERRLSLTIPRSEWIQSVRQPIGTGRHLLLELPLPEPPARERWEQALSHLQAAENFFLQGNDPEVLARCHAAFEAFGREPSDFTRLLAPIDDPVKQKDVNTLLKEVKDYYNAGRHVSREGSEEGHFAADHRDAAFGLGMAKLLLAYLAQLTAD